MTCNVAPVGRKPAFVLVLFLASGDVYQVPDVNCAGEGVLRSTMGAWEGLW